MANYDVICPVKYPQKCTLLPVEREALEGPEKYTAFFMYQFKDSDRYLKECLRRLFKSPVAHLLDAKESPATGAKLCNICRLTLAADFGVASLTPLNYNVFMEVGMLLALGKPVLYLVNPHVRKPEALPFDLSGEMVVEHTSSKELDNRLQTEVPLFLEKVRLYSEFQYRFREQVKEKCDELNDKENEILKWLLLENRQVNDDILKRLGGITSGTNEFRKLCDYGFVIRTIEEQHHIGTTVDVAWYMIHPNYRDILEEFLFRPMD